MPIARAIVLLAAFASAHGCLAADAWLTGPALQKRLSQPVNVVWSGKPLRSALNSLAQTEKVAVLLDRRIDPGRKLNLTLDGVSLGSGLLEIARKQEIGACTLGPVAYFGPPPVAERLRTLATLRTEEARKLPPELGRTLLQTKALAWPDLATPRDLLGQLSQQNGLHINGLERVPHDLWAAADLPPLTLADRLTLVAVQFDLTYDIAPDGKTVSLVPVPDEVAVVRSYEGGRNPQAAADQYAALVPRAQVKVAGGKVWVRGLLEDHEQIASPHRTPKPGETAATHDIDRVRIERMSVQNVPVGQVLDGLARKLNLELRLDQKAIQAAGVSLEQRVSASVQNATVDELLREVVKSTGLKVARRGNVVEVTAGK